MIGLCRCRVSGATSSKVPCIGDGCRPPTEPPSCGFLWEVDGTVGEPVHCSEHPTPALSHTGAHRCTQKGTNTTDNQSVFFLIKG